MIAGNTGSSTGPLRDGGATVHVIDDDEAVLHGLSLLLRSVGLSVSTHASGLDFLSSLAEQGEDAIGCVLTDIRMPGLDGLTLLRRLRSRGFRRPVIVMTGHGDVATAVLAMKAGATDFIEKPFDEDTLLAAIELALSTPVVPGPLAGEAGSIAADAAARIARLSQREREVLQLLVAGKPNKAIALELGLSARTVEVHRARLMARLGVRSLAEAVRLAVQVDLPPAPGA